MANIEGMDEFDLGMDEFFPMDGEDSYSGDKDPTTIKSYAANLGKSVGSGMKGLGEMFFPETTGIIDGVKEAVDSGIEYISEEKEKVAKILEKKGDKSRGFKEIIKDAKDEIVGDLSHAIKTGDLRFEDKLDSFGSMFGDDLDFGNEGAKQATLAVAQQEADTESKIKLFDAESERDVKLFKKGEVRKDARHGQSIGYAANIDSNVSKIAKHFATVGTSSVEAQLEFSEKMLGLSQDSTKILNEIRNNTYIPETPKGREKKDGNLKKVFGIGGFDGEEYFNVLKSNIAESLSGSGIGMLSSLAPMLQGGGGKSLIGSLGNTAAKSAMKFGVNSFLSDENKTKFGDIDTQMDNLPAVLNSKLVEMGNYSDNPILRTLGSIAGVKDATTKNLELGVKDIDAKANFTTKVSHSITDVIPGFLAKILSAVSGDEESYYDMRVGQFKKSSHAVKEYKYEKDAAYTSSNKLNLISENMRGASIAIGEETEQDPAVVSKDFDRISRNIIDSQVSFNPKRALSNERYRSTLTTGLKNPNNILLFIEEFLKLPKDDQLMFSEGVVSARTNVSEFYNSKVPELVKNGSGGSFIAEEAISEGVNNKLNNLNAQDDSHRFAEGSAQWLAAKTRRMEAEEDINLKFGGRLSSTKDIDVTSAGGPNSSTSSTGILSNIYDLLMGGILVYPNGEVPEHLRGRIGDYNAFKEMESKRGDEDKILEQSKINQLAKQRIDLANQKQVAETASENFVAPAWVKKILGDKVDDLGNASSFIKDKIEGLGNAKNVANRKIGKFADKFSDKYHEGVFGAGAEFGDGKSARDEYIESVTKSRELIEETMFDIAGSGTDNHGSKLDSSLNKPEEFTPTSFKQKTEKALADLKRGAYGDSVNVDELVKLAKDSVLGEMEVEEKRKVSEIKIGESSAMATGTKTGTVVNNVDFPDYYSEGVNSIDSNVLEILNLLKVGHPTDKIREEISKLGSSDAEVVALLTKISEDLKSGKVNVPKPELDVDLGYSEHVPSSPKAKKSFKFFNPFKKFQPTTPTEVEETGRSDQEKYSELETASKSELLRSYLGAGAGKLGGLIKSGTGLQNKLAMKLLKGTGSAALGVGSFAGSKISDHFSAENRENRKLSKEAKRALREEKKHAKLGKRLGNNSNEEELEEFDVGRADKVSLKDKLSNLTSNFKMPSIKRKSKPSGEETLDPIEPKTITGYRKPDKFQKLKSMGSNAWEWLSGAGTSNDALMNKGVDGAKKGFGKLFGGGEHSEDEYLRMIHKDIRSIKNRYVGEDPSTLRGKIKGKIQAPFKAMRETKEYVDKLSHASERFTHGMDKVYGSVRNTSNMLNGISERLANIAGGKSKAATAPKKPREGSYTDHIQDELRADKIEASRSMTNNIQLMVDLMRQYVEPRTDLDRYFKTMVDHFEDRGILGGGKGGGGDDPDGGGPLAAAKTAGMGILSKLLMGGLAVGATGAVAKKLGDKKELANRTGVNEGTLSERLAFNAGVDGDSSYGFDGSQLSTTDQMSQSTSLLKMRAPTMGLLGKGYKKGFEGLKDLGSKVVAGTKSIGKKGIKGFVTDKIDDTVKNVASGKGLKGKIGKLATNSKAGKLLTSAAKSVVGNGGGKVDDLASKLAKNALEKGSKLKVNLKDLPQKLIGIVKRVLKSKKIAKMLPPKARVAILKAMGRLVTPKSLAKIAGKVSAKVAAFAGPQAPIGIALLVNDYLTGVNSTNRYFELGKGATPSFPMMYASGAAGLISSLVFGIIPAKFIVQTVFKLLGTDDQKEYVGDFRDFMEDKAEILDVDKNRLMEYETKNIYQSMFSGSKSGSKLLGFGKSDDDVEAYKHWKENNYDPVEDYRKELTKEFGGKRAVGAIPKTPEAKENVEKFRKKFLEGAGKITAKYKPLRPKKPSDVDPEVLNDEHNREMSSEEIESNSDAMYRATPEFRDSASETFAGGVAALAGNSRPINGDSELEIDQSVLINARGVEPRAKKLETLQNTIGIGAAGSAVSVDALGGEGNDIRNAVLNTNTKIPEPKKINTKDVKELDIEEHGKAPLNNPVRDIITGTTNQINTELDALRAINSEMGRYHGVSEEYFQKSLDLYASISDNTSASYKADADRNEILIKQFMAEIDKSYRKQALKDMNNFAEMENNGGPKGSGGLPTNQYDNPYASSGSSPLTPEQKKKGQKKFWQIFSKDSDAAKQPVDQSGSLSLNVVDFDLDDMISNATDIKEGKTPQVQARLIDEHKTEAERGGNVRGKSPEKSRKYILDSIYGDTPTHENYKSNDVTVNGVVIGKESIYMPKKDGRGNRKGDVFKVIEYNNGDKQYVVDNNVLSNNPDLNIKSSGQYKSGDVVNLYTVNAGSREAFVTRSDVNPNGGTASSRNAEVITRGGR